MNRHAHDESMARSDNSEISEAERYERLMDRLTEVLNRQRSAQHYLQTVDDLGPKITWTPEQDYEIEQSVRLIAALENLRDAVFEEESRIEHERLRAAIAAHPLDDYELALRFLHLKG